MKNNETNILERILIVLEPHPEIARLLRTVKRKATTHGYDWEVLIIEVPHMRHRLTAQDQENLLATTTLAEQMGAIVTNRQADSILIGLQDILNERKQQGITINSIKVGKFTNDNSFIKIGKPLYKQLIAKFSDTYNVVAIPIEHEDSVAWSFGKIKIKIKMLRINAKEIFISLLSVAIGVGVIETIDYFVPEAIGNHNRNKSIIFMIACAFAAGRYGMIAGLVASVSSFLTLNMLYVDPYLRLIIDDRTDAVNLGLFLIAAFSLSFIGSRDYGSRIVLVKRADRFHSLFRIHRLALNKNTAEETIATLDEELKLLLKTDVMFFMPSLMDESKLETIFVKDITLNKNEEKALKICWEEGKTTGVGAPYAPEGCQWRFEPLITTHDEIGVLAVHINDNIELDADFGRLMSSIADQVALILERMQLGQIAEKNKIQAEREKLRSMLLSSVSHDLKTPLASVIGSLSVYRSMGTNLPEEHRITLINTALEEAQRLDGFITNILDMTRIESGQIELKKEWIRPHSLVEDVRKRLKDRLRGHEVIVHRGEDAEVLMDAMMTGQVLQNLLDNATKYTCAGTKIEIDWRIDNNGFELNVRDHGVGIPEDQLDKVFDKYARINRQDSQVAGTGLGLAIARAVMHEQGGDIRVANHSEGGALFTLVLPEARTIKQVEVA